MAMAHWNLLLRLFILSSFLFGIVLQQKLLNGGLRIDYRRTHVCNVQHFNCQVHTLPDTEHRFIYFARRHCLAMAPVTRWMSGLQPINQLFPLTIFAFHVNRSRLPVQSNIGRV
jgi:hypothetical protein